MGLNKKNTEIIKQRFRECFNTEPTTERENEHGADSIWITTDQGINLQELIRLKEGVHNTMSLIPQTNGKILISVW